MIFLNNKVSLFVVLSTFEIYGIVVATLSEVRLSLSLLADGLLSRTDAAGVPVGVGGIIKNELLLADLITIKSSSTFSSWSLVIFLVTLELRRSGPSCNR